MSELYALSRATEALLAPPFEWRFVAGGKVLLEDASQDGGTPGGAVEITSFAIAKYLITNAQYQRFLDDPSGYTSHHWWDFSPQAAQWRKDHARPRPTAFPGVDLPRTRVSWFDAMAFCNWLCAGLEAAGVRATVRLPLESEWQRAALGDTGWSYPWGDELSAAHANFANHPGRPTRVGSYPAGASAYGAMDMIGNIWEWCLSAWTGPEEDLSSYAYRVIRGGAWNVSKPEDLRATARSAHPPRGQLNDCGFRCACGL